MNSFVKQLFALSCVLVTIFSSLAFAQTSGDGGSGGNTQPTTVEEVTRDTCLFPWTQYQDFINNTLAYQAAVADNDYTTAQDVFTMMQDSLLNNCDTTEPIIDVGTTGLDVACLSLVDRLVVQNRFYIGSLQTDDAIDTQAAIQTILTEMSCEGVLAGNIKDANNAVRDEIANIQAKPQPSVIPFEENVCFMEYGPSETFTQQINSLKEVTLLDGVYNKVTEYIASLDTMLTSTPKAKEDESVLLKFAETVVDNRRFALRGPETEGIAGLNNGGSLFFEYVESLLGGAGRQTMMTWIDTDPALFLDYIAAMQNIPLRDTYADKQALFDDLTLTPRIFMWNTELADFQEVPIDENTLGLSFIIPGIDEKDITIRFLEFDATVLEDVVNYAGKSGSIQNDDTIQFHHIVMDMYHEDEKIIALDAAVQYTETADREMDLDLYMKPYILQEKVIFTTDPETQIDKLSIELKGYGPSGCDMEVYATQETIPTSGSGSLSGEIKNIDMLVGAGGISFGINIQDYLGFLDEIYDYRQTAPRATSAPGSLGHVQQADLYRGNEHRAVVYPAADEWAVVFDTNPSAVDSIITKFRNRLYPNYLIPFDETKNVINILKDLYENNGRGEHTMEDTYAGSGTTSGSGNQSPDPVYGCTDPADRVNYNPQATIDNGSCMNIESGSGQATSDPDGGTGTTTPDPDGGTGTTTPDPDGGTGTTTPDPDGATGTTTPDPVYGCMEPSAKNYNPNATEEDGYCDYGEEEEEGGGRW